MILSRINRLDYRLVAIARTFEFAMSASLILFCASMCVVHGTLCFGATWFGAMIFSSVFHRWSQHPSRVATLVCGYLLLLPVFICSSASPRVLLDALREYRVRVVMGGASRSYEDVVKDYRRCIFKLECSLKWIVPASLAFLQVQSIFLWGMMAAVPVALLLGFAIWRRNLVAERLTLFALNISYSSFFIGTKIMAMLGMTHPKSCYAIDEAIGGFCRRFKCSAKPALVVV